MNQTEHHIALFFYLVAFIKQVINRNFEYNTNDREIGVSKALFLKTAIRMNKVCSNSMLKMKMFILWEYFSRLTDYIVN